MFDRVMVATFLVATTVSDPLPISAPVPVQPVTVNVLVPVPPSRLAPTPPVIVKVSLPALP